MSIDNQRERFRTRRIMQLYALDHCGKVIFAGSAHKHLDYQCAECQKRVRLRGGLHRQNHFFHLEPNSHCRMNGKGMVHLQVQLRLQNLLPPNEVKMEYRFEEINRIADIAWISKKIVFEIQCSPILAVEVEQRNEDYRGAGWQVAWILHDKRYNQWRLTAAEQVLEAIPHYFTDINAEGQGIIYDQYEVIEKGIRRRTMSPLQIDLVQFYTVYTHMTHIQYSKAVNYRLRHWGLGFRGDLVDLEMRKWDKSYLNKVRELELEMRNGNQKELSIWQKVKEVIYLSIVRPYFLFFQIVLEKMSK